MKRAPRGRNTWRCHECGEVFTAYAPAERHADALRHPRIELVVEQANP